MNTAIPRFQLIVWCGNFVERHSFHRVLGELSEIVRKLYLSAKFPDQKIRQNFSILSSGVGAESGSNESKKGDCRRNQKL